MKYNTFERLFSQERMDRYLMACGGDTRKAMTLYLWMNVDNRALLYGLDHVQQICDKINELKPV